MALPTTIPTGQKGWAGILNADFTKFVEDTGWSGAGVTYLNGYKQDSVDPIEYRTLIIGSTVLFMVSGYFLGTGKDGTIAQLPSNMATYFNETKYHAKSIIGRTVARDVKARFEITTDGKINLTTYGGTMTTSQGLWIDIVEFL